MKKYSNLLLIPALLIIIAGTFSGFSLADDRQTEGDSVKNLLLQRTDILQNAYYNKISKETAKNRLMEIETYPILKEDIESLNTWESTNVDIVKKMNFLSIELDKNMIKYQTYRVKILWNMWGLDQEYNTNSEYFTVLKKDNDKYKLSKFIPI